MAGIMDRLSRLIRANVNDLIDNAEDPEKMIDQILRDMQESISMARAQVAAMIAQEKELELDAAETKKLAEEWGRKAERAVTAGKDDLAREALRRKRDNEENSAIYSEQLGVQSQAVAKLKDQLRQLEAKYQTTLGARDSTDRAPAPSAGRSGRSPKRSWSSPRSTLHPSWIAWSGRFAVKRPTRRLRWRSATTVLNRSSRLWKPSRTSRTSSMRSRNPLAREARRA